MYTIGVIKTKFYAAGKIIEQFELGKVLFSGIKYTIEVIAILFGVIPLFYLFSKKMKLLITTFLLVTGLFYITHYFLFEGKQIGNLQQYLFKIIIFREIKICTFILIG